MKKVFISYSHADRYFAQRLYLDLQVLGCKVWIDEGEIKVGDRLIEKIGEALDEVDYVIVILSTISINSEWVKTELDIAMNKELEKRKIVVLPVLLNKVNPPAFLKGKLYADFSKQANYYSSLNLLARVLLPKKDYGDKIRYFLSLRRAKDLAELFELSLRELENISKTDYNQIFLLNNHSNSQNLISVADVIPSHKLRYRFANFNGVIGIAFIRGIEINVGNVRESQDYINAVRLTKSEIAVPIKNTNGITIGVINSESEEYNHFTSSISSELKKLASCLGELLVYYKWDAHRDESELPWVRKLPRSDLNYLRVRGEFDR